MKVIVIEDDPEIVEAVSLCFELRWPDVVVLSAGEGREGLHLIEAESPDIVILDIGLPDMDGFEVCRQIRFFSDVPIIILTVRDEVIDKVKGLEIGADDYLTKPFGHIELLARVKAVLRRTSMPQLKESEQPLAIGDLWIDFANREVHLRGQPVKLTPTEYNLLYHLARNAGRLVTHQTLLEKVWGAGYTDATDYLKVYIQRLRAKLEDTPQNPKIILTERGVGYKLARPAD